MAKHGKSSEEWESKTLYWSKREKPGYKYSEKNNAWWSYKNETTKTVVVNVPQYQELFMTFPEISNSSKLLKFDDLLANHKISHWLHTKLKFRAGLNTIGDLYNFYTSIEELISRVPFFGESNKIELQNLLCTLNEKSKAEIDIVEEIEIIDEVTITQKEFKVYLENSKELHAISFDFFRQNNIITQHLHNKFVRDNNIQNIADLFNKFDSVSDFMEKTPSCGRKIEMQINKLLNLIINDSDSLKQIYFEKSIKIQSEIKFLPKMYDNSHSVLIGIKNFFDEYLKEVQKDSYINTDEKPNFLFVRLFFIDCLNNKLISDLLHLTPERIRQKRNELTSMFKEMFMNFSDIHGKNMKINDNLCTQIKQLSFSIRKKFPVIATEEYVTDWRQKNNMIISDNNEYLWRFFCILLGIYKVEKHYTKFSKTTFYVVEENFDDKLFFAVGKLVIDLMNELSIPVSFHTLVSRLECHKTNLAMSHKNYSKESIERYLKLVLESFDEIECVYQNNKPVYQLLFSELSSLPNMAERILYEEKKVLSLAELVELIEIRLEMIGVERVLNENSLSKAISTEKQYLIFSRRRRLYRWADSNSGHINH